MLRLILFRVMALLGLLISSAMMVDYVRPVPAFCGFRSGCDQVVLSAYGRIAGLPLPAIGVVAFAAFYVMTLVTNSSARKLLGPMAIAAGVAGLSLVLLQKFVLRQMCPFCLMADIAAILLAAVELGLAEQRRSDTPGDSVQRDVSLSSGESNTTAVATTWRTWIRMMALALPFAFAVAPLIWSAVKPSPAMPEQLKLLQKPGKTVVVEITDFGCAHCRASHAVTESFRTEHADVDWHRLVVSMKAESGAELAAHSWMAADRQCKADAMADALFGHQQHTQETCRAAAVMAGLDLSQFETDMADGQLTESLRQRAAWVKASQAQGLPQLWINDVVVIGEPTKAILNAAWRRAASNQTSIKRRHRVYPGGPRLLHYSDSHFRCDTGRAKASKPPG